MLTYELKKSPGVPLYEALYRCIRADILAGVDSSKKSPVVIENRVEAIGYAMDIAKNRDIIVLAGKGHETYQEIHGVKHHLDEREEVAACLMKKRG